MSRQEYYAARNKAVRESKQQFGTLMKFAIAENRVPWQKDVPAAREQPHNPVTQKMLSGNALLQAALHQDFIGTKDPRYITKAQLKKEGYTIKPDAIPLNVEFSNKRDGKWETETVTYYNASQVNSIPAYKPPERASNGTVEQQKCNSVEKQFAADMASFITAVSTGKEFKPEAINRDNQQIRAMTQPALKRLGFEAKNISENARYAQLTREQTRQQERPEPQKAQAMAM